MFRKMGWLIILAIACGSSACFLSSSGTVTPSAPDPTSPRISQINAELGSIEQQLAALGKDRKMCEDQRNQSFLELGKASGTGPKPPSGFFDEETVEDPGMLISMHNQNLTIATDEIRKIDNQISNLNQRASQIKNERTKLEQTAKAPSAPSPGPGGCFTPDTTVLLESGGKSIINLAAGDTVMVFNEATSEIDFRPVVNTFRYDETHYYILNQSLRATALHRFMTEAGWVPVKDLKIGTKLKTADGWKVLESKKLIEARVAVFNLEVAEHHDFFIAAGGERYLVHNTGGGGK